MSIETEATTAVEVENEEVASRFQMGQIRAAVGRAVKLVLPDRYWTYLQSVRSRNRQLRWLKAYGVLGLAERFSHANGLIVLHGPFAGMKYPSDSILSRHSVPKLLGSYEQELHGIVNVSL